ncbi:MAG: dihydrodipicolinate synthase family protein [Paenibacillaceae bacterium]|jgi:4-hydroxy-tetrahydrodipicolinate synthase|nr:dihydrodipicolinate synthase family protein [Paenibacillaceae bacterium]
MIHIKLLYGVTTAMITPFDAKGKVDFKQVAALTDFLIGKGVHCLYPLGTTGEMLRLSVEERKAVAETVVQTAAGRVVVYIHVGAMNQEDTVELAAHAHKIGADGIGCVTPVFFGLNDREMEEYYIKVAASVPDDFPVYLYNIPQCSANDLKSAVAERIATRCPNVVGIKYSYADMIRTNEYLAIGGGTFSVMQGADRLFLPTLAMGCDGTVSGTSSVYPEPFVRVYEAFQRNDLAEARRWQQIANSYVEVLRAGSNMAYFKAGLTLRGIDGGHIRAPQLDLTEAEKQELVAGLRKLNESTQLDAALEVK